MNDGLINKNDIFLMCKDVAVYNVSIDVSLKNDLLPGAMLTGTMSYDEWMKSRYSADSNTIARRLMMRAFGTDNHGHILKTTRALSLSDCYWLKAGNDSVSFNDVSPYYNKEWDGSGIFSGGSISTLFVNGAATKEWINSETLVKYGNVSSFNEFEVYEFCGSLDISNICSCSLVDSSLHINNFTSSDVFLESLGQSGFVRDNDHHIVRSVEIFGDKIIPLLVVDFLTEHDDRHSGNIGFLRDSNTGAYVDISPFYDFDWSWSCFTYPIPDIAFKYYSELISDISNKAISLSVKFKHGDIISRRAKELLSLVAEKKHLHSYNDTETLSSFDIKGNMKKEFRERDKLRLSSRPHKCNVKSIL